MTSSKTVWVWYRRRFTSVQWNLYKYDRCDGDHDCYSGADEEDCDWDDKQRCGPDAHQCGDGTCIHSSWVCDIGKGSSALFFKTAISRFLVFIWIWSQISIALIGATRRIALTRLRRTWLAAVCSSSVPMRKSVYHRDGNVMVRMVSTLAVQYNYTELWYSRFFCKILVITNLFILSASYRLLR